MYSTWPENVAQLVAEHEVQLVPVEDLDGGRAEHDERAVDADRTGVDERDLGDEQLRDGIEVEHGTGARDPEQPPHHAVEPWHGAHGRHGGAVGGIW